MQVCNYASMQVEGSGGVPEEGPGGDGCSGRVEGLGGVPKKVSAPGPWPETHERGEVEGVVQREALAQWGQHDGQQGEEGDQVDERGPKERGGDVAERGWGAVVRRRCFTNLVFIYLVILLYSLYFKKAKNANKQRWA